MKMIHRNANDTKYFNFMRKKIAIIDLEIVE